MDRMTEGTGMIVIDGLKMPKICGGCFASNQAQYGAYAGKYFCAVRSLRGVPFRTCLIELGQKPEWCPLREVKQLEVKK